MPEVIVMQCPFCGKEMTDGALKGDSRIAPKWESSGAKPSLFGSGRVIRNTKRTGTLFEIGGYLCESCGKAIVDVKL